LDFQTQRFSQHVGSGKEVPPEDFERKGDEARGGKDENNNGLTLANKTARYK
jgi:hypothetical protein